MYADPRHLHDRVHVLGVAPDTSGEPLVQVSVMLPSKYHYLDTWRLGLVPPRGGRGAGGRHGINSHMSDPHPCPKNIRSTPPMPAA